MVATMRVQPYLPPPKKRRSLKERWRYFWDWYGRQTLAGRVLVALAPLLVVAAVIGGAMSQRPTASEKFIHEHRAEWIDECGDYATSWVDGTVYVIGGHEWMHQLNRCLQEKANDQTP